MDLKQQLKQYEGTKEYQTKVGYFKNGKYWQYKDSLGYPTIGFGHLVLKGEDFSNGLTEAQADALLDKDIAIARAGVASLGVNLPVESRWNDFLVMMVFQLGLTKTRQFKRFLAALNSGNYARAIIEIKYSNWYRQTPARVDSMIAYVVRG
ncbi:glycoside hydrolase family protein [Serratia marcescens]|uniref:glycoside hydrolase family protein n=1 Tax=Serratia marcescens TaxID=615 RepID=UPI0027E4F422|nr:glycoside hydrolase family protein [Serratia marcescens]WLS18197.1 glycoside hydrolase family protein [Serratia marcescens]WLS21463.1 glycoside hydrolase family protein [Serratia marcescens]HCB1448167.1 glycoside hydrolase family protein [Serratia marcescens]HCB1485901.1 glycoside hydrolase family protein [Serratia marcescens]HCB1615504.1 glycoside hydrolase family protein [Serratia marcescens]